ncbi:MAG: TIGR00730 family Rossman fold protein [bacterium]|nr:TIGR00730 family Rossman fold protein [bacterium]
MSESSQKPRTLRSVCVFCGSSPGARPVYLEAAAHLGRLLAEQNIALVYGGADVGLMGHIAQTVQENGGHVIGVIPQSLVEKEVAHQNLPDLRIVKTMHERKALMEELSDGFIAIPGGFGTIDELAEILTWSQLGFHDKAIGLWNVEGYFDLLLSFFEHMIQEKFLRPANYELLLKHDDAGELLKIMADYRAPFREQLMEG